MGYTIGQDGILKWTDDDVEASKPLPKSKSILSRPNRPNPTPPSPNSGSTPYRRRRQIDTLVRSLHVVSRALMVAAIILGVLMAIENDMALDHYINRVGSDIEAIFGRLEIPELLKALFGNRSQSLIGMVRTLASPDTLLVNISSSIYNLYTISLDLLGLVKGSIVLLFKLLKLLPALLS